MQGPLASRVLLNQRSDLLVSSELRLLLLAVGTETGFLRYWDVAGWNERGTIQAHNANLRAIAFSPDGKWMATASFDRTVKLWDVP